MSGPDQSGGPESPGFSGRVEAAARSRGHAPKGKGVVMILIAVSVMAALIWDFSGRGAASRRTREEVERSRRSEPVVAPKSPEKPAPADPEADKGAPTPPAPPTPRPSNAGMIKVRMGQAKVSMRPEAAVAWWLKSPDEEKVDLGVEILAALVEPAAGGGVIAGEAFEAAAWLMEDLAEEASEAILHLTNATTSALKDDRAASGAIVFLSRLTDGVDKRSAVSLDGLIADPARPLRLRIAAARIRPKEGRPARILRLGGDANVHPALRDALK